MGSSPPKHYHLFLALRYNLADHKFKYSRKAETNMPRWLITRDIDVYQHGIEKNHLFVR